MKKNFESNITPPQESKEKQKFHENIHMQEWMAEEMIEDLKNQGRNPAEISFSAGFDKTSDGEGKLVRSPFFTMNFRDGNQWFKAYWNPETKGEKLEVEYSGETINE